MVKVKLRFCISAYHSGCPFQYDALETTTIGEICNMVLATNNHWWDTGNPLVVDGQLYEYVVQIIHF